MVIASLLAQRQFMQFSSESEESENQERSLVAIVAYVAVAVIPLAGCAACYFFKRRENRKDPYWKNVFMNLQQASDLSAYQVKLDARYKHDWTPMHYVAVLGNSAGIQVLAEAGHRLNAFDEAHYTPLHRAIEFDQTDVVCKLVELRASMHCLTDRKESVLHLAAYHGRFSLLLWLLDQDATLQTQQNDKGETYLHVLLRRHRVDLLRDFLAKNQDRIFPGLYDIEDHRGITPLQLLNASDQPHEIDDRPLLV